MLYRQITKHYYSVYNIKDTKREWYRLRVDGIKSDYDINRNGELKNHFTQEKLPVHIENGGYPGYYIVVKGSPIKERFNVGKHRLLAACFIPIPKHFRELGYDQTMLVPNHKDGIKSHSTLDNLEWVTTRGNAIHAQQTGLLGTYSGERSHLSKITDKDARLICEEIQNGLKPREVAEKYGYPERICRHIYDGECWKWMSKEYDFSKAKEKKDRTGVDKLVQRHYDDMERICNENEEINELLHMDNFDNTVDIGSQKILKRCYARYVITSSSDPKKEWQRIVIDGVKTKYKINKDGIIKNSETGNACEVFKHGCNEVHLHVPEIRKEHFVLSVGRIVASIFLPIPKDYRELGFHAENFKLVYKDGNTCNDSLCNLEWVLPVPKSSSRNNLTDADADRICKLLESGLMPKQISEKTGYSIVTIRRIRSGENWTHISKNYTFVEKYNEKRPKMVDESVVRGICDELTKPDKMFKDIAKEYDVKPGYVSDIYRGLKRTNISKDYVFADRMRHKEVVDNYNHI